MTGGEVGLLGGTKATVRVALAACFSLTGGLGCSGQSAAPDASSGFDAQIQPPADASPGCLVAAELGALETQQGPAARSYNAGSIVRWRFALNGDEKPDYLDLGLYAGYGALTDGINPGSYELTGDELNYASCGICVTLLADGTPVSDGIDTEAYYMVTGGLLELSAVDATLEGQFTGLTFEHVDIDPTTLESTPVGDGCVSNLGSVAFDVALE